MVKLKISSQPDQVNSVRLKLNQWLRFCLANNIFAKGFFFFFQGIFSLGFFWGVLLQKKMGFCQTKLKKNTIKIIKKGLFFLHMAKILKII